jgi:hypothetical protein
LNFAQVQTQSKKCTVMGWMSRHARVGSHGVDTVRDHYTSFGSRITVEL